MGICNERNTKQNILNNEKLSKNIIDKDIKDFNGKLKNVKTNKKNVSITK
jgi:hypothetical protein